MERQLTVEVHPDARNGSPRQRHLKLDFADWKEVFENVMAKQLRPASEAGPSYLLIQAKYCRARARNPSSFPLFLSCAQ